MSSPAEYYNSLPPISKAYGTLCFLTTVAIELGVPFVGFLGFDARLVFTRLQIWRLVTNFFLLGGFSFRFAILLIMIARYGVQLENGPFEKRTADFLWMMIFGGFSLMTMSIIPMFRFGYFGAPLISMLLYVWSREFPNARISIYGLFELKGFYLPWMMLGLDLIFGVPLTISLSGIIAGHIYYFLSVLHPLASGKNYLKTPKWMHKLVMRMGLAYGPTGEPVQPERTNPAFRGRSYRLNAR